MVDKLDAGISSRAPSAKSPFLDRRILVLAAGMFAIGTDSFVVAGILMPIADEFAISIAAAGQLITVYAICYAVCTPIAAVVTSNWPRQHVLLAGLVVFIAGNLMACFGPDFGMVLFGRATSGIGAAIFAPTASATAATVAVTGARGSALAVMMTALSVAMAFGAPLGTVVGALEGWRATFLLVACIAAPAAWWIPRLLKSQFASVPYSIKERMRPVHDRRVIATMFATFLVLCGLYVTYTYIAVVLDRATQGNGVTLASLLSIWGLAATVGSVVSGGLTDRFGSRVVINSALVLLFIDFVLLPWTSATYAGSAVAVLVWGLCGWGFVIPQQHRMVGLAPQLAPILLGLYAMTVYAGTSLSGVIGAVALAVVERHQLPLIGAGLIALGLVAAEHSYSLINSDAARPGA